MDANIFWDHVGRATESMQNAEKLLASIGAEDDSPFDLRENMLSCQRALNECRKRLVDPFKTTKTPFTF